MELWKRMSEDAQQAILRAHGLAVQMGSPRIAPQHLALGIIDIEHGSGYEMLRRMGVNIERLRAALMDAAPMGPGTAPDEVVFTDQAERCLRTAYLEWQKHAAAGRGGTDAPAQSRLESVHLLLGLLAPSSRCECRTLISHGVFYGEVSELLRRGQ